MITTITELKCKNYLKLPGLIFLSMKIIKQAKSTPGNISALIKANGLKAFTLTSWEHEEALKSFRNTGYHKQAMKAMNKTASAFRFKTWETECQIGWNDALIELDKVKMNYTKV